MAKIKSMLPAFSLFKYPFASIDGFCVFWLEDVYRYSKKHECMTVIGHPKNFSPSSFPCLEKFIIEKRSKGNNILTLTDYITRETR